MARRRSGRVSAKLKLQKDPILAALVAEGVELLQAEEGVMLEAKLEELLVNKGTFTGKESFYNNRRYAREAVNVGQWVYLWERAFGNERWYPKVIRLPGITRTKPKTKYLGVDVD